MLEIAAAASGRSLVQEVEYLVTRALQGKIENPEMGRPRLAPGKRRGASMGFRPTPAIREKLEKTATENGRSMSQEIETRLELSFARDNWTQELKDLLQTFMEKQSR